MLLCPNFLYPVFDIQRRERQIAQKLRMGAAPPVFRLALRFQKIPAGQLRVEIV